MKTLLIAAVIFVGATVTKDIDVQYINGESEPIGAMLHSGVLEYKDVDGKKSYWITGKALKELTEQVKAHSN